MSTVRRVLLALILVCVGLVWLRVNQRIEGQVLLVLTSDHGFTTADLISVSAFAAAAVLIWPERRR